MHDYKEGDPIHFQIDIEELKDGKWVPYVADDIQVEFVRIDPYWRLNMERVNENGSTYFAKFRTPDQNGVFKFRIDYMRAGLSKIFLEEVAPNRIWKHDEHERVFLAYA